MAAVVAGKGLCANSALTAARSWVPSGAWGPTTSCIFTFTRLGEVAGVQSPCWGRGDFYAGPREGKKRGPRLAQRQGRKRERSADRPQDDTPRCPGVIHGPCGVVDRGRDLSLGIS